MRTETDIKDKIAQLYEARNNYKTNSTTWGLITDKILLLRWVLGDN
jgi:hypothetical protein